MDVFCNYPINSKENPFDINSKGKYCGYLTNRQKCFSYLSDNLKDFEWQNESLYKAMSMGYTNLWILERLFLINSSGEFKKFSNEKFTKIATLRSDGFPKDEWKVYNEDSSENKVEDYHRFLFEKDNIDDSISTARDILKRIQEKHSVKNLTILGVGLIEDYFWH
jgi:hypothetical protein